MCGLVVLCRKFGLDPGTDFRLTLFHSPLTLPSDNIAPPVAACLGDLVTLSLLGVIAELHLHVLDTPVPIIIVILLFLAAIGWTYVTHRNENVRHLLTEGWSPLFIAMIISTGTGIVLDTFVERYSGFALLAVVIAGAWHALFECHPRLDRFVYRSPRRSQCDLCLPSVHSTSRCHG